MNTNSDSEGEDDDDQMEGYWQRRRRLDGALNRVPLGFYTKVSHSMHSVFFILGTQLFVKVWKVLEKCQSLRMQTTNALFHGLTQEVSTLKKISSCKRRVRYLLIKMTSGELKFALRVEMALNTVPVPELRQLMVETLLVLYNLVEYRAVEHFGGNAINVEEIVREANRIFLQDQRTLDGDAILCCAQAQGRSRTWVRTVRRRHRKIYKKAAWWMNYGMRIITLADARISLSSLLRPARARLCCPRERVRRPRRHLQTLLRLCAQRQVRHHDLHRPSLLLAG